METVVTIILRAAPTQASCVRKSLWYLVIFGYGGTRGYFYCSDGQTLLAVNRRGKSTPQNDDLSLPIR